MGRALFDSAGFLAAARTIASEKGPAAVTVESVTGYLRAPKGSFYYRYASRDALLGELWLATALSFQEGFVRAVEARDGLAAALHTPQWVRAHMDDARLLMLYNRHDFVHGEWPEALREGVLEQAKRFESCVQAVAKEVLGRAGPAERRRVSFALIDVPLAAVKHHLHRGEPPPPVVDVLISETYLAILGKD